MKEITQYHKETIKNFLVEVLEISSTLAEKDSIAITKNLSEQSVMKIAHFFDCMIQCSSKNTNKTCSNVSNCNSCCGKCHH